MKKLSFLILTSAVLLLASCASAPKVSNISTIPEIAPGSLLQAATLFLERLPVKALSL